MQNSSFPAHFKGGWRPVDPRYRWLLRAYASIVHIALLIGLGAAYVMLDLPVMLAGPGAPLLVVSWAFFFRVWAARRARRLRYRLGEFDFNLQMGFLFWKQMSMSMNRIQHLEVNQGPLQRLFGLATLAVFSAGTHGSDMQLPGLALSRANELKSHLLAAINAESPEPVDADSEPVDAD